ncbi:MAG: cell division protein FtsQ [Gaiellaceae bacterium]|nr:cell division protein FtsQ [Gaiellaceae bacterium]
MQRRSAAARAPRARAVAAPAPRARRAKPASPAAAARFLPSGRSILVGLALLALAGGAYVAARQTSMFAVAHIEVSGGSPVIRAQVRHELAALRGTSLLALDGAALERRLESLPTIVSARYDRAFPHTLRLTIVPETPVAVLHRGSETWLLSSRGRAVAHIRPRTYPALPRIWVPRATEVAAGTFVQPDGAGRDARALAVALAARFPVRIATAAIVRGELLLRLRSGLELRLGQPTDVRLKLAIARRALRDVPAGSAYLDVSVPGRPVAGSQPSTLK